MQRLILLHSNDIHARIDGLARIATLVDQIRAANPAVPICYLDAGDSEDTTNRLSNLTKGVAMHRLLSVAGCAAAAVGNAALQRYGVEVLAEQAAVAQYPLLLANLRLPDGALLPGTQATALLEIGELRLGLVGMTWDDPSYAQFFGLQIVSVLPLIRECAAALRQDGADAVILLSHMGLRRDRELAAGLQADINLIIGAHTHDLLPEGEWVGQVMLAQAGQYAEHLGQLDLSWDGTRLRIQQVRALPVPASVPPAARVLAEAQLIEAEIALFLDEIIGELAGPLDFTLDQECGVGNLMADLLRERMAAEVGVVAVGQAFTGPLPSGPLRRGTLWDACPSPANPGVVTLTGTQLAALVERGLDPQFASEKPRPLRGQARGLLHLSGAQIQEGHLLVGGQPVAPERLYRVAGTDWEFEPYGGYADPGWDRHAAYDVPLILREAAEAYLAAHRPAHVSRGRLG